jgi:sec-independent protein translocase protein TatB
VFNVTGSEIVIVLLLALVVLGPEKLPDAVRRFAKTYAELKKVGTGFQQEFKAAMDEPLREMRETADLLRTSADFGAMVDPTRVTAEPTTSTSSTTSGTTEASPGTTDAAEPVPAVSDVAEPAAEAAPTAAAEPVATTEPPERPKQIWSAAPPYRRPAATTESTPADGDAGDREAGAGAGAGDPGPAVGGDVTVADTDAVEDRSA